MIRFSDFYQDGHTKLSIEIFPPKTESGVLQLFEELTLLKAIHPAFVSVTYGAMGSTRHLTKDLALRIHQELKMTTAFHFTCVGSNREEVKDYVHKLADAGIELIVALRGDVPKETGKIFVPPQNGFRHAHELVSYLQGCNRFSIAVAGYPEKHIEAKTFEEDLEHLKCKVESGADIIITQLFFNNEDYYRFVDRIQAMGLQQPVVAGIMPILHLKQVEKITGMCGAKIPEALFTKLSSAQDDPQKIREIGTEHAMEQCEDLIRQGVPGIHFYCLNKSDSVLKIVKHLKTP